MAGRDGGAVWMDPRGKSDFEAGLLFFSAAARMMPGLTWQDVANPQFMAGWFTDIKKAVGGVKDGIGDVLKDTTNFIAKKGGEAVRLAADPDVSSTVARGVAAYYTGGASEAAAQGGGGIMDFFKNMGIMTPTGAEAVEKAGASYKAGFGIDFRNPWVIGAGIGGAVLLVALMSGGRRG